MQGEKTTIRHNQLLTKNGHVSRQSKVSCRLPGTGIPDLPLCDNDVAHPYSSLYVAGIGQSGHRHRTMRWR